VAGGALGFRWEPRLSFHPGVPVWLEDQTRAALNINASGPASFTTAAQNRCSPEEAFAFLRSASNSRNTKLREVAASIVASIAGRMDVKAHFQE
jgi:hypothetical protein